MCIAILNIKSTLPTKYIKNSWDNNNQGGGLLFVRAGKLDTFKTYEYKEFLSKYMELRKDKKIKSIVLHFRIATSGFEKFVNLHPFLVNSKLGFVHNGFISGLGNKEKSDTWEFNEILKKLPLNFLRNESIKELLSNYIDYSKLIFLDDNNGHTIINEGLGIWEGGNWFSNDSYKDALPFSYFGNNKVYKDDRSSWGDYNLKNDIDWDKEYTIYDSKKQIEDSDELMGFQNATEYSLNKLANILGVKVGHKDFYWELNDLATYYRTFDIEKILENLIEY